VHHPRSMSESGRAGDDEEGKRTAALRATGLAL
jgi:hypothetical protein